MFILACAVLLVILIIVYALYIYAKDNPLAGLAMANYISMTIVILRIVYVMCIISLYMLDFVGLEE